VDRAGLRLKLLAQQAAAGDLVLLFADESACLTHPYLAYVWAKRGEDLRVAAPGQAQRRALLGALDAARRELVVVTSARKRSADFLLLLERLDRLYGPAPGRPERPVVLVLDTDRQSRSARSTPARRRPGHWRHDRGSRSNGCPSMPLS
jgi:DDE superfamily endonuclease